MAYFSSYLPRTDSARNMTNRSRDLCEYWWQTGRKRKYLTEKGTHDYLENLRKLRDERNGTNSPITPMGDTQQNWDFGVPHWTLSRGGTHQEQSAPDAYRVTVINSMSGEEITTLDMAWDQRESALYEFCETTVEMVGFELEQWGNQTLQNKSCGYIDEGFSFMRNSRTATEILPPETKLVDLNEGHEITLRVLITWIHRDISRDKWLHIEYRNREAIAAVNDSTELIKLARRNIASPWLSNIGANGRCKSCDTVPHFQSACSNCGDVCCNRCNDRINWEVGNVACFRCFPTVIKVVLNHFDKNNILEWTDHIAQPGSP